MLSEIRGELLLDERGCLRVRHQGGGSPVILWPSGFEAERSDAGVRVLDREGKVVARVGEAVYMGGGGTPIRGNKAVDDRARPPSVGLSLVSTGKRALSSNPVPAVVT